MCPGPSSPSTRELKFGGNQGLSVHSSSCFQSLMRAGDIRINRKLQHKIMNSWTWGKKNQTKPDCSCTYLACEGLSSRYIYDAPVGHSHCLGFVKANKKPAPSSLGETQQLWLWKFKRSQPTKQSKPERKMKILPNRTSFQLGWNGGSSFQKRHHVEIISQYSSPEFFKWQETVYS